MTTGFTWVNGGFVEPGAAALAVDDALLVGRGIFETLRVSGGAVYHRDRHRRRLADSAAIVGVDLAGVPVEAGVDAAVAAWGAEPARLRITVTASGSVIVTIASPAPVDPIARVVIAPWPRNERSPLCRAKTISGAEGALAFDHARARGATEALFLNTRGELCEGSRSNVFLVREGELLTPALDSGCLPGITRALVLEHAGGREATLTIDDLRDADEAFLTSALRGAQPIGAIDGAPLAAPGPRTRAVQHTLGSLSADA